jgi:hypothetical protein
MAANLSEDCRRAKLGRACSMLRSFGLVGSNGLEAITTGKLEHSLGPTPTDDRRSHSRSVVL